MRLTSENTNLSSRTINVLAKNNINTIDELLAYANSNKFYSKKRRIRGLGTEGKYEILKFVNYFQGTVSDKQQIIEAEIKAADLAELEKVLRKNIEKYGVEVVADIYNQYAKVDFIECNY